MLESTVNINSGSTIGAEGRAALEKQGICPETPCFHCATPVGAARILSGSRAFCCQGCLTVFELLSENGLTDFYQLSPAAGVRVKPVPNKSEFEYLDDPSVRQRLVDFTDERTTRVTFHTPEIHCIACVWLLENLFRLKPGIGQSRVNFARREVSIIYENDKLKLSALVSLLASLGYPPELKFANLDARKRTPVSRRLWLQLGVAGFAFGNIMLLSIASYFGLDGFSGPGLKKLFGLMSFGLALPVVFYSASAYWRAAWLATRRKMLTIEVPVAVGIAALAARSTFEVFSGHGEGYFDSLAGLLFFLLCGKLFQQRTYERLAFDRDYKSFFPLAITRKRGDNESRIALSQLEIGDRLLIRNGELIPTDARLISGAALIDYSFVTGESELVAKNAGDHLYAGGRQIGSTIELEALKAVSQSYLTSLWNQQAFHKEKGELLDSLTNRYSRHFSRIVISIAVAAALYWWLVNPTKAVISFTAVLIVACPCALALAAPFTLGAAQRVLARRRVYLKNSSVIETLARVDTVVFDKTGTLTAQGAASVVFHGDPLSTEEQSWINSLSQHSNHPCAVRVADMTSGNRARLGVCGFMEKPGYGMKGIVADRDLVMGSPVWMAFHQVRITTPTPAGGTVVHLALDGAYRGSFVLTSTLRPDIAHLIGKLGEHYELALLSGDNETERNRFGALFGASEHLHFNQSPLNKLGFIRELQSAGKKVMMVGDGLNDAGALKQSDVGAAVVEDIGAFSPASDVIMAADMVPRLDHVMRFGKRSVHVVRLSFLISGIYNVIGISLAARGLLSPIICAVLMPVSSVTVMAFACGLTNYLGRRILGPAPANLKQTEIIA